MTAPQRLRATPRRPRVEPQMQVLSADKIRRARKAKGWSQRELAGLCGRSQNAVHKLETGQTDRISESFAMRLAKELDLQWEHVFGDLPDSGVQHTVNQLQPIYISETL